LTVARTLSTFRLPPSAALAPSQLTILEQPDLTLGAHLWHCALVLAYRLLHHRDVLGMDSHQIVELGAGCGLVSQLCAVLNSAARICATDLEDVVSVSTAANFERFRLEHPKAAGRMSVHSLDWAANLPAGLLVGTRPLTVLACDVLYNVESHQIFLDTVSRLFASAEKADAQCLIGYKQRTVGDAAFFDMARGEGLHVECLPGMGLAGVEIWRLARPR
jgi:predicted nicotinamide N-methyase